MNNERISIEILKYKDKILSLSSVSKINCSKPNELIEEICKMQKSNIEWIRILKKIIEQRGKKYNLKLINGIRNNIKWNALLFVEEGFDINSLAKDEENGIIFFAPDLYREYFLDKKVIVFDAFYIQKEKYFAEQRSFAKLVKNGINNSLYDNEINNLYELLFNEYKNKEKRSKYVRSKKV